jgi:Zn-dependent peptidase ImmA (M78 family)
MSNDYKALPLSDQRIEVIADWTRKNLAIPEDEVPDIIDILNRREIRTRYGIKQLSLEIVPDGHLQGDEAQTLAIPGKVEIKIGKSIFEKAKMRDGHALMTLTHELGHAVLHEKPVPLARPIIETKRPEYLRAYESAEHQAKYFAPERVNDFETAGV